MYQCTIYYERGDGSRESKIWADYGFDGVHETMVRVVSQFKKYGYVIHKVAIELKMGV